jgi:hypothetical protein
LRNSFNRELDFERRRYGIEESIMLAKVSLWKKIFSHPCSSCRLFEGLETYYCLAAYLEEKRAKVSEFLEETIFYCV